MCGTYNIGTGQRTTPTEVYGLITSAIDGISPRPAPDDADDVQALALNAAKAGADLSWTPRVDLADGIHRTMDWLYAMLEPTGSALASA